MDKLKTNNERSLSLLKHIISINTTIDLEEPVLIDSQIAGV